jgi:crotonobetainyl-CoA:carnitine CoA-transferase CaiB-like acyl-CoA transferase/hydroxyacyl-ACP dehydratase HTD2-like protein with hotdog domain
MNALEGILVVAVEHAVAGPFATRQLADLGARVIKIELPGRGDFARRYDASVGGMSSYFAWLNRGKESIELDLRSEDGRGVLDALLARADVLVENLSPMSTRKLGLEAGQLRPLFPRLIVCDISGYGSGGPYENKKAYDLLIQGETGLLSVTGLPYQPAKAGISVADIAAGMYGFSGVLSSLYERERTGRATSFTVAMIDALGEWMTQPYLFAEYGGSSPVASGAHHATIAPYGPAVCADGEVVLVAVHTDAEWHRFCRDVLRAPALIEDSRFLDNPSRVRHRRDLDDLVAAIFVDLTGSQARERLDRSDIANAAVRSMAQFSNHPQLAARGRWREVNAPGGSIRQLAPPITVAGRPSPMRDIPALGQHTDAVLKEFAGPGPEATNDDAGLDANTGGSQPMHGVIVREPSEALANLLGADGNAVHSSSVVLPLWHWVHLVNRVVRGALGPNGLPVAVVPAGLPDTARRLAAGGRVTAFGPLRYGAGASRFSRVATIRSKVGRTGPLTFVTWRHEIRQEGKLVIVDEQDVVYRSPVSATLVQLTLTAPSVPDVAHYRQVLEYAVDPVTLFRFSALTHDMHRIHYDEVFARQEGYADRVTHGPLLALLMRKAMGEIGFSAANEVFTYRLHAPLFCGQRLGVEAVMHAASASALVRSEIGQICATAQVAVRTEGATDAP